MKRTAAWHAGGKPLSDRLLDLGAQAEQARLRRHELILQLGAPGRMGEIAGRDHADAFAGGPCGQMFEVEIAAGRARIFGVDVQIGVKVHRGQAQEAVRMARVDQHTPRANSPEKALWMNRGARAR